MTSGWVLAIDFGTTFTSAAVVVGGRAEVLEVDGHRRFPSTVLWLDGELVVGPPAEHQRVLDPSGAERNPKRYLGVRQNLLLAGTPIPVVDAVAAVLRAVVDEALRRQGGTPPSDVRLTHPAQWGSARLDALREAAAIAGLDQVTLMAEPVAAAIHYGGSRVDVGEYVAVYDLGGGTFDTAVLRRVDTGFELAGPPGGDDRLGGEDFDHRLMDFLLAQLASESPDAAVALRESPDGEWRIAAAQLLTEVRQAKEALSRQTSYSLLIPPPVGRSMRITRAEFEALIRADVQSTIEELRHTIERAGVASADLSARYLTGGSSRIPLVARLMHDTFSEVPDTFDDPKTAVALGAARAEQLVPSTDELAFEPAATPVAVLDVATLPPPPDPAPEPVAPEPEQEPEPVAAEPPPPPPPPEPEPEPEPELEPEPEPERPVVAAVPFAAAPPPPAGDWTMPDEPPPPPPPDETYDDTSDGDGEGPRRNQRLAWMASAAVVLVLLLGAGAWAMMGGDDTGTGTTTTKPGEFKRGDDFIAMELPADELPSGVKVEQEWRLEGAEGDLFASEVTLTNPTDEERTPTYYDVVPTKVAKTQEDAELVVDAGDVADDQPSWVQSPDYLVAKWNVKIPPGESVTVRAEAPVDNTGLDESRFQGWRDDWNEDKSVWDKPPAAKITSHTNEMDVANKSVSLAGTMNRPGTVRLVSFGPNCEAFGEDVSSGVNNGAWSLRAIELLDGKNCLEYEAKADSGKVVKDRIVLYWKPAPPSTGNDGGGVDPDAPPIDPGGDGGGGGDQPPPTAPPATAPPTTGQPQSQCATSAPSASLPQWNLYWNNWPANTPAESTYAYSWGWDMYVGNYVSDPYGCGWYLASVTAAQYGWVGLSASNSWAVSYDPEPYSTCYWDYFSVIIANASYPSQTRSVQIDFYVC